MCSWIPFGVPSVFIAGSCSGIRCKPCGPIALSGYRLATLSLTSDVKTTFLLDRWIISLDDTRFVKCFFSSFNREIGCLVSGFSTTESADIRKRRIKRRFVTVIAAPTVRFCAIWDHMRPSHVEIVRREPRLRSLINFNSNRVWSVLN